jgi:hypothetical protein
VLVALNTNVAGADRAQVEEFEGNVPGRSFEPKAPASKAETPELLLRGREGGRRMDCAFRGREGGIGGVCAFLLATNAARGEAQDTATADEGWTSSGDFAPKWKNGERT